MTPRNEPRPHCYRCDKPQLMCLCSLLSPLDNRVQVHILQHPKERKHALGTVRLLRLGLASVTVHMLDLNGKSTLTPPIPMPTGAGLLYPTADALDLSTLAPADRPKHLVVIDGTWDQAHRIYRENNWISDLPHYRLTPEAPSRYRIRAEPRHECLSTLESVVAALRSIEPELDGTESLIHAFDAMIDAQIEASKMAPSYTHRPRIRQRASRAIPPELTAPGARNVVVYTETAPRTGQRKTVPPILRLSACTLDGRHTFDRVAQSDTPVGAYVEAQMGLVTGALESALSEEQVVADFQSFLSELSPDPVVLVAWGINTRSWLDANLPQSSSVQLKKIWANVSRARVPGLDTLVAQLGLADAALKVSGRAGRRLSLACGLTRYLLSHPSSAAALVQRVDRDAIRTLRARVLGSDSATVSGDGAASARHWAILQNGKPVACASVLPVRGHALRAMAVAPEHQRTGLGARMLRVVHREVDGPMWCNARLAAVPFYAAMGWQAVGPVFELSDRGAHQRMTWEPAGTSLAGLERASSDKAPTWPTGLTK